MMSFVIVHGPDMANKNHPPHDDSNDNSKDISVLDIYDTICQLLNVEVPKSAGGNAKRASLLLRPSEPKVVKVLRNWMSYALLPENIPVTS